MDDISRRMFAAVGAGTAAALAAGRTMAQVAANSDPSPENLARALPAQGFALPPHATLTESPALRPAGVSEALLPGFTYHQTRASDVTINVAVKGNGRPLLLVHGHPETHVAWHKVAPKLVEAGYQVVLPDLRGYGDSSKPGYSADHANYSFRVMSQDLVEVMASLGHRRFMAAGHDRGGRVLHRLCLDHAEAVEKVALLDIAPTLTMYDQTSKEFATKYLWWFLQIQPSPMPEYLISLDPLYYLRDHLSVQGKTAGAVTPEAMAEYARCYCCSGTIRAVCEDYRAAAGIDLDMDRADDAQGNKIKAPLLALWGAQGTVGKLWDVLATWRAKSDVSVEGRALPCGHLLPEEQPELVAQELVRFFA